MATNNVKSLFHKIFNTNIRLGKNKTDNKVILTRQEVKPDGKITSKKEKLPPKVQELFNYFLNNCHDNLESFENRMDMLSDMDMLYFNCPLIARAINLYADEVVQADANKRCITVEGDEKQRDFIYKFIDDIGLEALIRPIAHNVIHYGEAGLIPSLTDKGVEKVTLVDPYDIETRLEFTPHEIRKHLKRKSSSISKLRKKDIIGELIQSCENNHDYTSYFQSHLLGFQVGEFVLAPWQFIHFRNYVPKSPFAPHGMPIFIHAVSPYRQLEVMESLDVAQRGAKIPIEKFEVNLPANMSPTAKLDKVLEFIEQYENSSMKNKVNKETVGIGERIYTIKDLVDHDLISPDIRVDGVDNIDNKRDDIVIATGLPRNFLDPNNGSYGNSGVALIQQFKPFARTVYHIQSILLNGLSQLIKLHMLQSGSFAYDDINFQLSMPYPESQTDRDYISSQSDSLRLANDIISALGEKLTGERDPVLPPELVKRIYSQILPYDADRIEGWVNDVVSSMQSGEDEEVTTKKRKWESHTKKYSYIELDRIVEEEIVTHKIKRFSEGVFNNKHFYTSRIKHDFDLKLIIEHKKRKLMENFGS